MNSLDLILKDISFLTHDSRKVSKGALFFALEGKSSYDGHDFVETAFQLGACAAVIKKGHAKERELRAKYPNIICVENTRKFLAQTAAQFYLNPSTKMTVCGVTGTNGKTTSTYLLESIFKHWGKKVGVMGTIENRLEAYQVPSSLTTLDSIELQKNLNDFFSLEASAIAMEVSSHALDQYRTWGTHFAAVLFTHLTQDHLDYHETMEGYFSSKAKLFLEYPVGIRAIHVEDPYGKKLAHLCLQHGYKIITFGKKNCHVNYEKLQFFKNGIKGPLEINFENKKEEIIISSSLLGEFNAQNIAGTIAVALGLKVPTSVLEESFLNIRVPGRLENIPNLNGYTIVVDYAHTPNALQNVLETLRSICQKKLICVFGCGGDRDHSKRPVMGAIAQKFSDEVFVTSDNPRTENPNSIIEQIMKGIKNFKQIHIVADRKYAITQAISKLTPGDVLLIAGKGHEDYQIIGSTKYPFSDRKVVEEVLASIT